MLAETNARNLNTDVQCMWHGRWSGRSRIISIVNRRGAGFSSAVISDHVLKDLSYLKYETEKKQINILV